MKIIRAQGDSLMTKFQMFVKNRKFGQNNETVVFFDQNYLFLTTMSHIDQKASLLVRVRLTPESGVQTPYPVTFDEP